MKPSANTKSTILNNLSIDGKFAQENIVIGRGMDETIALQLNNGVGIRYVPNQETGLGTIEYTDDGTMWHNIGMEKDATYEPILFTQSDLQNDGCIKIQHNFNNPNVLCLGYCPQPKEITYLDNELVLDYSDQNSSNLSGAVWFINSQQSMLVSGGGN